MAITNPNLINQYTELHNSKRYGQTKNYFAPHAMACIVDTKAKTVLEYGCGRSTLNEYVSSMPISWTKYDPALEEYAATPSTPHDLIICTDVMEHIPEKDIDDVLSHMNSISRNVFFNISTRPAKNILPNGENAHCTVWDRNKWLEVIRQHFPDAQIAHYKPEDSCLILTWSSPAVLLIQEIERLSIAFRKSGKKSFMQKLKLFDK